MLKKVQEFIHTNQLLAENERVLVGVSGGADSVVLLDILVKLKYDCIVAHCNFHLRGAESDRDEIFVKKLAKTYNLTYKKVDFDTISYVKTHKISIEMAARELRYNWFEKMATETKATSIAVAHHADDNIETVLLNLGRGTGLKGITGMEMRNGKVVRPLLNCYREEIEQYAEQNNLEYVTDSTNTENEYKRNKIRNQIIPLLAELNPSVKATFSQNIRNFKAAWNIYSDKIEQIKALIVKVKDSQAFIHIQRLKQQTEAQNVLFEILSEYNFNSKVVEDIFVGLDSNSGLIYHSPTHRLLKDREQLIIDEIKETSDAEFLIPEGKSEICEPIKLTFRGFERTEGFKPSKTADTIHIDADKVKFPLRIRKWQQGDRFQPFGMTQNKKLSDFFIDEKLSIYEKENCYLLISDNEIVWVIGMRLDNRFRVDKETRNILEISTK